MALFSVDKKVKNCTRIATYTNHNKLCPRLVSIKTTKVESCGAIKITDKIHFTVPLQEKCLSMTSDTNLLAFKANRNINNYEYVENVHIKTKQHFFYKMKSMLKYTDISVNQGFPSKLLQYQLCIHRFVWNFSFLKLTRKCTQLSMVCGAWIVNVRSKYRYLIVRPVQMFPLLRKIS